MNHPKPDITVNVDVTNPGQFFACCGLLELADRLWPGAEGWFEDQNFCLICDESVQSVNQLIYKLFERPEFLPSVTKKSVLKGSKLKLLPFRITFPESILKIDWWRNDMKPPDKTSRETCAKSPFKTWAGNQSPPQIIYDRLLPAMRKVMDCQEQNWFSERVSMTGRFGFDHTAAVKSIDLGWSPDKLKISVKTSPAIELLAMLGLQRFQPVPAEKRDRYLYRIWSEPTVIVVAPAKLAGVIHDPRSQCFCFDIEKRGDYSFFGTAIPT